MLVHSKIARGYRSRSSNSARPATRWYAASHARMEGEEERAECRGTADVVGNLHRQRGQMARHDDGGAAGCVAAVVRTAASNLSLGKVVDPIVHGTYIEQYTLFSPFGENVVPANSKF